MIKTWEGSNWYVLINKYTDKQLDIKFIATRNQLAKLQFDDRRRGVWIEDGLFQLWAWIKKNGGKK